MTECYITNVRAKRLFQSVPFSKKIGNMVAFRKASRTSIPFEQEHNLGREKLSTFGEKRIKCMVPLMDLNKKKEQICGSSLHTFDQVYF